MAKDKPPPGYRIKKVSLQGSRDGSPDYRHVAISPSGEQVGTRSLSHNGAVHYAHEHVRKTAEAQARPAPTLPEGYTVRHSNNQHTAHDRFGSQVGNGATHEEAVGQARRVEFIRKGGGHVDYSGDPDVNPRGRTPGDDGWNTPPLQTRQFGGK